MSHFIATLRRELVGVLDLEIIPDPAKLPVCCYQKMKILESYTGKESKQLYVSCARKKSSMSRWDCHSEQAAAAALKSAMFSPVRRTSLSRASTSTSTNIMHEEEDQEQQRQNDTKPRQPARQDSVQELEDIEDIEDVEGIERQCCWASSA